MKINSSSGVSGSAQASGARRAGAGGFSVDGASGAAPAAPLARTGGVGGIASVDALLALQEVDGPLGRRRRAVSRAGRILDVLDDVKIALLDGDVSPEQLHRLTTAVREQRAGVDDEGLTGLLDQIETRAQVELAKIEARLKAA